MVAIRGTALTALGRDRDPGHLVETVTAEVLDDAERTHDDIDALVVANAAGEAFTSIGNVSVWTATQAGLAGTPTFRVNTGPSSGLAALAVATSLSSSPGVEDVMVLGWETMTSVPTEQATRILGGLMAEDERACGLSLPGLVAMMTAAYLDTYGRDVDELAQVSHKAHRLAANNPIAQFRNPISLAEVASSRMIAAPLRLLHCAPLTDGAAAAIVSQDGPVAIDATGAATDLLGYTQRRSAPEHFAATSKAAAQAFDHASFAREDVDVIELHDAFASLEAINLEDLGFAAHGEGLSHVPGPEEDPLAASPSVNPSGGLKARGHPIGATGLAQVAECFDQLTGRAANQVPQAHRALVHSIGGFGNNVHVALLEARG